MKLLAIDGNSILNRAFYGIKLLSNKNGVFTNAIFGFMNIYLKNLEAVKPDCVAVAFDLRSPTFRHKAVSSYKANRKGMPDELAQQLPLIKQLLELMGITVLECEGYEADDILGTLAKNCSDNKNECYILTGDRDSLQLIDDNVTIRLATNKDTLIYTPEKFKADYGFEPINLIDLKALMGDSSDNISGVAGIGEKTASALIKEYATIENLYQSLETADIKKGVLTKLENGRDSAKESKWLATICTDAPISLNIDDYKISEPKKDELSAFLTELEMFKLMDKIGVTLSAGTSINIKNQETKIENINPVISELENSSVFQNADTCFYLFDGSLLKIRIDDNVYFTDNPSVIVDFMCSDCKKITINAKPHYKYAFLNNTELKNIVCDLEICGYLLNTSSSEYTIEKMCAEYHTYYYSDFKEYSDLLSLKLLSETLLDMIENEGMLPLMNNVELPLTEVLASMEHFGVKVNIGGIKEFGVMLREMIEEVGQMIFDDVGHEFNILSPKQLGIVLFEELKLPAKKKTKTGYSTSADVLEELRNYSPVVDNVLKYRQYTKLNSTYVEGLLKTVADDGRIHSNFNQTETRTGRISSTEPNMQNIPVRTELGRNMRKFFVADDEKVLIDADYSQIELRVMAHLCGDDNMINAFNSGEDIHTSTAAQVFDMPPIMVTPEMRSAAKAVNFGIIYGMGAFSLAKDINVPLYQAKEYINEYFEKYPNVKAFMDNTVENAIKTGFVLTEFGRKRRIPELLASNKILQAAGKRIAMNTPVQGTAADLIKMAMINVYRRLKSENINARLILQVHDELIIEADSSAVERAKIILHEEMIGVYELKVPLVADFNVGDSWYDAKG